MADEQRYLVDKQQARRAFAQAAEHYDEAAALQREVADRLLERLELVKLSPRRILDLGCGTGRVTQGLLSRYKKAKVVALDIAFPMARQTRKHGGWFRAPSAVCADAERLPFADNSFDLLISNLMLQWCQNLDETFAEFQRVLAPGGLLLFTSFGPDTLKELRISWATVDDYTHVNAFMDMHDVGDAMLRAGLAEPVMDVERMTVTYDDVRSLMRDLKQIGAHNVTAGRCRNLMGKQKLEQVIKAYEQFRLNGRLPASYEVVHGHAWATEKKPSTVDPTQVSISIDKIGRPV